MNLRRSFAVSVLSIMLVMVASALAGGEGKSTTVKGYVLDSACAFIQDLKRPISTECALACAKAGSPLVILADDGTIYWPIPTAMPATSQNPLLMKFAGKKVTASGKVFERRVESLGDRENRSRWRVSFGFRPPGRRTVMPKAKQLTAWVEDRPGMLGELASALGAKKVNIQAFMSGTVEGRAAIRLIVDKPSLAKRIFAEHGWDATEEDVAAVTLADKPGSLGTVAGKLRDAGINIQYAYTGSAKSAAKVNSYFAVSDVAAALKALR